MSEGNNLTHLTTCNCAACASGTQFLGSGSGPILSAEAAPAPVGAVVGANEAGYVQSLLGSIAHKWHETNHVGALTLGTAARVGYTFEQTTWGNPHGYQGAAAFTADRMAAALQAMDAWSSVANVTFFQDGFYTAEIAFRTYTLPPQFNAAGAAIGYQYTDNGALAQQEVMIDTNNAGTVFTPGSFGYATMVHELGHAIGLKHPGNYNANGSGADGPYLSDFGLQDSTDFTVMSYAGGNYTPGHAPASPMLYDIAALQKLYGVNTAFHSGNDVYDLRGNSGVFTRWDGAGNDTLSSAAYAGDVVLDLREGEDFVSHAGASHSWNAFGANIENATAGAGDDNLFGSALANILNGGAGNDAMTGGAGNDTLLGGAGVDTYVFSGNGDGRDQVTDADGTGALVIDNKVLAGTAANLGGNNYSLVASGVTFNMNLDGTTLHIVRAGGNTVVDVQNFQSGNLGIVLGNQTVGGGATAGNDTLTGTANADTIDGLAGNDVINGMAGNDSLVGSAGADTLFGGEGNDTLDGGTEADMLRGEAGNDVLRGGAGLDLYSFEMNGHGRDSIIDADNQGVISIGLEAVSGVANRNGDGTYTLTVGASTYNLALNAGTLTIQKAGGTTIVDIQGFQTGMYGITLNNGAGGGPTAGDDTITGTSGADSIDGLAGNDSIHGGTGGADTLAGGEHNDMLVTLGANSKLFGGNGNDTLTSTGATSTLEGGDGDDVFIANGANSRIVGGAGNDTITANAATIAIDAGVGNDRVTLAAIAAGTTVNGGDGNDILTSTITSDTSVLMGDAGNDTLTGSTMNDSLVGGSGNDSLTGGVGNDTLEGGTGDDTFFFSGSGGGRDALFDFDLKDVITIDSIAVKGVATNLGNNNYSLVASGTTFNLNLEGTTLHITKQGGTTVIDAFNFASGNFGINLGNAGGSGTAGPDNLTGTSGADSINGGDGADTINGGTGGADTLVGGNDFDILIAAGASSKLLGEAGNDTLTATGATSTLDGGEGDDVINANGANNLALGGLGIDRITLAGANGSVDGGEGNDLISAATSAAGASIRGGEGNDSITIRLTSGTATIFGDAGNDTMNAGTATVAVTMDGGAGDDSVVAGSGNDVLSGNAGSDTLRGGAGNDTISSLGFKATLDGNDGNDTLTVTEAECKLYGGAGNDTISLIASKNSVDAGAGNDTITIGAGAANATIRGGDDNDTLTINVTVAGSNSFAGDAGDDMLNARTATAGINFNGGDGNDSLIGGSATDTLLGGNGSDYLFGGLGDDAIQLRLDKAADSVVFMTANDGALAGQNSKYDYITGYETGLDKVLFGGDLKTAWDDIGTKNNSFAFATAGAINFTRAEAVMLEGFTKAELTQVGFAKLVSALNARGIVAAKGADGLIVAESSSATALYSYVESATSNSVQANELTLLAVIDNGTAAIDFGFII